MGNNENSLSESTRWAVIFDNDGVLVDSEHLSVEAYDMALAEQGVRVEDGAVDSLIGLTDLDIVRKLEQVGGKMIDGELFRNRKALLYFQAVKEQGLHSFAGIPELVNSLVSAGIPIAVASSGSREKIEVNLSAIGLFKYFPVIISGEEVKNGKPAPDIFMKAAEELGVPYDRCIVIEDSINGLIGAKAGGMKSVGFTSTFPESKLSPHADLVVDSLKEISVDSLRKIALNP